MMVGWPTYYCIDFYLDDLGPHDDPYHCCAHLYDLLILYHSLVYFDHLGDHDVDRQNHHYSQKHEMISPMRIEMEVRFTYRLLTSLRSRSRLPLSDLLRLSSLFNLSSSSRSIFRRFSYISSTAFRNFEYPMCCFPVR